MATDSVLNYYALEFEKDRLEQEIFKLEGIRTKEIIERYLGKEKLNIIDIGGGAGFYSFWLHEKGHSVTLVDLTPENIALAKAHAEKTGHGLSGYETANATRLNFE